MRVYLTHCSKDKSPQAKASGEKLPPDQLYTDAGLQEFIAACKSAGVAWAILSDQYGVFSPDETHEYYEKPPASVTSEEENVIRGQFTQRLAEYGEIWFYTRPNTFHPFYQRVLTQSFLSDRIHLFTDLGEIR